jgi:hypothetical protein
MVYYRPVYAAGTSPSPVMPAAAEQPLFTIIRTAYISTPFNTQDMSA